MLYSVFPELVNMSLTATVVILAVLLLRPLLRRAPRSVTFLLWGTVLFRLVCPVSFSADFALLRGSNTVDNRIQYLPVELIEDSVQFSEAESIAAVTETAEKAFTLFDLSRLAIVIGTWVWVIGIVVFLAVNTVSLFRLLRKCIGAVEIKKHVYLADHIRTPFVLGIFRPRIYLPSDLTDTERSCILYHERTHIRRGDPLWKLIAFLALAVHWFNPVVWLGFRLFVRDMETACDERVLRVMDENARADYAETLLRVSTGRRFPSVSPAFGEDSPKTRIKSILRYKKPLKIVTVLAVAFVLVCAVLLLANPQAKTGRAVDVLEEFPRFTNVSTVELRMGGTESFSCSAADAATICSYLSELEVEVEPASKSRAEDRDMVNTITINGQTEIHFNTDFSRIWVNNGVKPSYTYVVSDPALTSDFLCFIFKNSIDPISYAAYSTRSKAFMTVLYCPAMKENEGSIKVGVLAGDLVSDHLIGIADGWKKTSAPRDNPSSPESVEFVIDDTDLRVQIWKDPKLAVIKYNGTETWYKIPGSDYEAAVEMLLTYALTPAEAEEVVKSEDNENIAEPSASPTAEPTPTPTAEPTVTPSATAASSSAAVQTPTSIPSPSAVSSPVPTPKSAGTAPANTIPGTNTPTPPPPNNIS